MRPHRHKSDGVSKRLISATNTERTLADKRQRDDLKDRVAPMLAGQQCFDPDACNVCVQEVEARMACFRGKALLLFYLASAFPQSSRSHLLAVLSRVAPGLHKYIGQLNSESALSVFVLARDAIF